MQIIYSNGDYNLEKKNVSFERRICVLHSFCIKTNNKHIIKYLHFEFENCNLDGLYISMHNFKNYKNIIVHCKNEEKADFCALIAGILTRTINKFYEANLINEIITSNYFYFSDIERKDIFNYCIEYINSSPQEISYKNNLIFMAVFNYTEKNKYMVLDGFVNFRIKEYIKYLDELVDISVDKFVIDREYNEFIDLLKLYIESRKAESQIIHLIYYKQESMLLDINKKIIDTSSEIFDAKYLSDITFSSNDYALNALLTLLPEKLYVHLIDEECDDFINTLKQIFEDRVKICKNCMICNIYKSSKDNTNKAKMKN